MKKRRKSGEVEAMMSEVESLIEQGVSVEEVAAELDVTSAYVYQIMNRLGISSPRGRRSWIDSLSEEVAGEIIEAYNNGDNMAEILTKHAISYTNMYTLLRHRGVSIRDIVDERRRSKEWKETTALQMYRDGAYIREITMETGVSQPRLHYLVRANNVPLRSKELTRSRESVLANHQKWELTKLYDPDPSA